MALKRSKCLLGKGVQRKAFKAKAGNRDVVAKYPRDNKRHEVNLHQDVADQQQVREWAEEFNRSCGGRSQDIEVLDCWMETDQYGQEALVEDPLPRGKFRKFNDRFQPHPRGRTERHDTTDAFSHFTWIRSGQERIATDMQGVMANKFYITDPAIETGDSARDWMIRHQCNGLCMRSGYDRCRP